MIALDEKRLHLDELTSTEFASRVQSDKLVVLLPVGSLEPHGPHLPLGTDMILSDEVAVRASKRLRSTGVHAWIAPQLPYGVTECAQSFPGVVTIGRDTLTSFVGDVVGGLLGQGVSHVCVINNHLEPEHDEALKKAIAEFSDQTSYACPLVRRFARTLSDEFKSGKCHAGQYETSLVLAARPNLVGEATRAKLSDVDVSLSEQLQKGVADFVKMGMKDGYAGAPAAASAAEGEELYTKLVEMVCTLVKESGIS